MCKLFKRSYKVMNSITSVIEASVSSPLCFLHASINIHTSSAANVKLPRIIDTGIAGNVYENLPAHNRQFMSFFAKWLPLCLPATALNSMFKLRLTRAIMECMYEGSIKPVLTLKMFQFFRKLIFLMYSTRNWITASCHNHLEIMKQNRLLERL